MRSPIPNLCHNQTHPDRLAVIGRLLGMQPAPVTNCRVLELAAAKGGNLAPLAQALPDSEFVGLDYSAVQVAGGQELLAGAGSDQCAPCCSATFCRTPSDLGEFDYIIAHGLYSWTTEPVRQRVLAICQEQLAPQGIAFISFNALPGWSMLRTMREMMLFRTRGTLRVLANDRLWRANLYANWLNYCRTINILAFTCNIMRRSWSGVGRGKVLIRCCCMTRWKSRTNSSISMSSTPAVGRSRAAISVRRRFSQESAAGFCAGARSPDCGAGGWRFCGAGAIHGYCP